MSFIGMIYLAQIIYKIISDNNIQMFQAALCCCSGARPRDRYIIATKNNNNQTVFIYTHDLKTVEQQILNNRQTHIRPIIISEYRQIVDFCRRSNKKFEDGSFPPKSKSLGDLGISNVTWKRVTKFINYPMLFDYRIDPIDVVHKNKGDCYLLSAIAALAQNQNTIKNAFYRQQYADQGVYRIILRVDGVLQEVIVDDYIPLDQKGAPLFCQPKIKNLTGEFWTLMLEKALAKAKGSYANLMEGTPSDIFQAVTYCPAQSLAFQEQDSEKIWKILYFYTSHGQPCCATTKNIISKKLGLVSQHTYTVLAVGELTIKQMSFSVKPLLKKERVVKLRNAWSQKNDIGWVGKGSLADKQYWDMAQQDKQYQKVTKPIKIGEQGVFTMPFEQFVKYFRQIDYCHSQNNTKTSAQVITFENNNPGEQFFDLTISHKGFYTFQITQSDIYEQTKNDKQTEGYCRSSLVLFQVNQGKHFFKGGKMKHNQKHLVHTQQLKPGKYVLYTLIDPSRLNGYYPNSAVLSIHSSMIVNLTIAPAFKYTNLLRQAFINDGIRYENKTVENNGLMTISSRILFNQGGFAYIYFKNEKKSDKNFVIEYDENDFDLEHIQIIEPQKHDKYFTIRVQPGHDMLILTRAKNKQYTEWTFPPRMSVKMEPLFG